MRGAKSQLHQWNSREASNRRLAHVRARGSRGLPSSLSGEGKRVCQTHAPLLQPGGPSREPAVAARNSESRDSVLLISPPLWKAQTKMFSLINMYPSVHPGQGPRALHTKDSLFQNKTISNSLISPQAGQTVQMLPSLSGQHCFPPQEGSIAPPVDVFSAVGSLALRAEHWQTFVQSKWVLRTIEKGYRLQFAHSPPRFSKIIYSQAEGEAAHFLRSEITSLLEKKAIQMVPPAQSQSGFYSRYFVVPKKGGGMRPILDLRALNKHLRQYRFRMLTHVTLLKFVRPGDWFTTLDLADAYYHIRIYPPHRKFLRFAFQGVIYEYLVLPFGRSE